MSDQSVLAEIQAGTSKRYSLARACVSASSRANYGYSPDGLEGEVHAEIARRYGRSARGFFMPHDVELRSDTTTSGAGAAQTVWAPGMFIDVLRAKLIVKALGGQVLSLTDEPGAVQLPVQTGATSTAWVAEGSNAGSNSQISMSSVTFFPHTVLANTGISRKLNELAAPGFDTWLYGELGKDIAVAVDAAAINGTGLNQPVGILQASGVQNYTFAADVGNGGAPAYADLVAMEAAIGNANADATADDGLGWATSPNGRSKLRRTDSSSGNAGQWCWPMNQDTLLGKPAQATTNVPNNSTKGSGTALTSLIYGGWADLIVNLFSAVDILVNPFALSALGYIQISAYQEVDVQVRRAARFITAAGMVTT